ncbi:UNVERIFIED_CONTAM: hypothetical protein K2H54_048161 [Gekko kuhli]
MFLCEQEEQRVEHRFEKALREKKGFIIKQMKEDGACLFRAVGDYGSRVGSHGSRRSVPTKRVCYIRLSECWLKP